MNKKCLELLGTKEGQKIPRKIESFKTMKEVQRKARQIRTQYTELMVVNTKTNDAYVIEWRD